MAYGRHVLTLPLVRQDTYTTPVPFSEVNYARWPGLTRFTSNFERSPMRRRRPLRLSVAALIATLPATWQVVAETTKPNTGDQVQKFTFGYSTSASLVLPVLETCPSPLLVGVTPISGNGPDPTAPYTMVAFVHEQLMDGAGLQYERIYARTMDLGTMGQTKSLAHPWMNGTQFIGCMWAVGCPHTPGIQS